MSSFYLTKSCIFTIIIIVDIIGGWHGKSRLDNMEN